MYRANFHEKVINFKLTLKLKILNHNGQKYLFTRELYERQWFFKLKKEN